MRRPKKDGLQADINVIASDWWAVGNDIRKVFYDIGNADSKMDWGDLHDDYGLGIRVKTPFGNLRLDYAYGDDENKTYFGFGEIF